MNWAFYAYDYDNARIYYTCRHAGMVLWKRVSMCDEIHYGFSRSGLIWFSSESLLIKFCQ